MCVPESLIHVRNFYQRKMIENKSSPIYLWFTCLLKWELSSQGLTFRGHPRSKALVLFQIFRIITTLGGTRAPEPVVDSGGWMAIRWRSLIMAAGCSLCIRTWSLHCRLISAAMCSPGLLPSGLKDRTSRSASYSSAQNTKHTRVQSKRTESHESYPSADFLNRPRLEGHNNLYSKISHVSLRV